jgi:hypothetical protein
VNGRGFDRLSFAAVSAVLTIVWEIRLEGYLFTRIITIKMDHLFDDKRDNTIYFAKFRILQAAIVFVMLLPVASIAVGASAARILRRIDLRPAPQRLQP